MPFILGADLEAAKQQTLAGWTGKGGRSKVRGQLEIAEWLRQDAMHI